jgi:hypothetical protein
MLIITPVTPKVKNFRLSDPTKSGEKVDHFLCKKRIDFFVPGCIMKIRPAAVVSGPLKSRGHSALEQEKEVEKFTSPIKSSYQENRTGSHPQWEHLPDKCHYRCSHNTTPCALQSSYSRAVPLHSKPTD